MTNEYDPLTVPVSPAATVVLIDDRPDLQVLLLRRTTKVVFGPGNWVFPGGRVDPTDHIDDFDRLCQGLSDREASGIIEVDQGGLAWWVAACRETLEEAGLLLATDLNGGLDVATLRDRVRADESQFVDLILEHNLTLDMSAIEEVARFITPVGPPRRFDARFFIAKAPPNQIAKQDNGEIVNLAWLRPSVALERWQRGEMTMMPPTVRMLACLSHYETVDEAMRVARKRLPYQRVRVADPEGAYRVLLPGEAGYEEASLETEIGSIRLWETSESLD